MSTKDNKKLLVEYMPFKIEKKLLTELREGITGPFKVKGPMQRANAKNQNGRYYSKTILEREIKNYKKEFIEKRRALGELDHPDSTVVNLKNKRNTEYVFFLENKKCD